MAGRADRRTSDRPGQGRVPPIKAVWRRLDRTRRELPAEDGPGRRGGHLSPREQGDRVQPERLGAVVPAPPRDARSRPHRGPRAPRHGAAQARRIRRRGGAPGRRGRRPRVRRQRAGGRCGAQERRENLRGRRHRRRRRLLPHQARAEGRLGIQRVLRHRDPLGDAPQPARQRQPRHLSEAALPGRSAARIRLGVPDGQQRVQHRVGLCEQLQELAGDQCHPVPRRLFAHPARRVGSTPDRRAQEEQERAGLAIADGLHRVAAVAPGRAVHR